MFSKFYCIASKRRMCGIFGLWTSLRTIILLEARVYFMNISLFVNWTRLISTSKPIYNRILRTYCSYSITTNNMRSDSCPFHDCSKGSTEPTVDLRSFGVVSPSFSNWSFLPSKTLQGCPRSFLSRISPSSEPVRLRSGFWDEQEVRSDGQDQKYSDVSSVLVHCSSSIVKISLKEVESRLDCECLNRLESNSFIDNVTH